MKSFKEHLEEAMKKVNLDGVEIIMGATKNAQEAAKEVAKAYKISAAEAKKLVQQVMKRAMKK
jgi:polyhydroxyalkanoate synthesis regulator phasin